jgi:hypothetical protein
MRVKEGVVLWSHLVGFGLGLAIVMWCDKGKKQKFVKEEI